MTTNIFYDSDLYQPTIGLNQIPIIYRDEYNIAELYGLENKHIYRSDRWKNAITYLIKLNTNNLNITNFVSPNEASEKDLTLVHSPDYLTSLTNNIIINKIMETLYVGNIPNNILQKNLLKPFRYQTGGSVLAGKLAMERGWSINIGGGFHHAHREGGGGFCFYADVMLTVQFILNFYKKKIKKVMIIDLDAHQANGIERDIMRQASDKFYILDVYNSFIYPSDIEAKKAINCNVELSNSIQDEEYLKKVETCVENGLTQFNPDIVIYIAGSGILDTDSLGRMSISREGLIRRDEIVFTKVISKKIPIITLMGGGLNEFYFIDSILNLNEKKLISLAPGEAIA